MDAGEALKWASGFTVLLGGGALGIKRLLTTWSKESANASGMAATNEIIDSLRAEVERSRKHADYMGSQYEESMLKIMKLQKDIAKLRHRNNMLELNNMDLKGESDDTNTAFTDSDISSAKDLRVE